MSNAATNLRRSNRLISIASKISNVKIIEKISFETAELNENTQSSLIEFVKNFIMNEKIKLDINAQLTQITRQCDKFMKKQRFKKILITIERFEKNSAQIATIEKINIQSNAEITLSIRRRNVKLKKISLYHDKTIKKHLNFVKNATTIFQMIFENFFTKKFKILFVMQSLIKEFKKSWYYFEKIKSNHKYIFEKFNEYLFNFVENSMNRQFHQTQLYADAKQKKIQSVQNFDVYLNILKTHLFSYIEQQRIMNFFTKLKSKLRIVLTNY